MASLIPGYEYDIFISYRHKDNKYDGWVSEFVVNLRKELEATFKEDVSIYFDENPHDGLLETHNVDKSLEGKLKCLIFIPIISQTYCDEKSFAWQYEFVAFNKIVRTDAIGREVKVSNGNVTSRILPVKIHEIDAADRDMIQNELEDILRPVDFIYKSTGVNRPLRPNEEHPDENIHRTIYRNQINKVANAVKEIFSAIQQASGEPSLKYLPSTDAQVKKEKKTNAILKTPKDQDRAIVFSGFSTGYNRKKVTSAILYSFGPAVFLSLVTGVLIWNFKSTPAETYSGAIRSTILLPEDKPLEFIGQASLGVGRKSLALSKDGRKVAYVTRSGETAKLMIRSLDNYRIDEIPDTEGAYNPVFSTDGKYLVFFQKNYVKRLVLQNNAVSVLAERPELWDATWSTEGELFFSSNEGRNLYRYFQTLELIDTINLLGFKSIQRIPQTDYLLSSFGQINMLNTKTLQRTKLDIQGTNARYIPAGYIIFLNRSSLMAVRFDIQKLKITSDVVEVLKGIRCESSGDGQFDFSSDGKLVFVEGVHARKAHFVFYDHKRSRIEPLNFPAQDYGQFDLSPDGTRIAVSESHLAEDIYIYELKTRMVKRLTNEGGCRGAIWHPDGQRIYFSCKNDGCFKYVDNEEPAKLLLKGARVTSFFQNGKMAVVQKRLENFISSMEDTSLSKVCNGGFGSVSPAGNYISFTSSESGEMQVYLQDLDSGKKWQVSTEGGSEESRWSSDGRRLFYRSGQKWMEVSVRYTPSIEVSAPKEIFRGEFINVPGYSWDISSDDEKFLLLQSNSEKTSVQISMIQGWFDELTHLVPVTNKNTY